MVVTEIRRFMEAAMGKLSPTRARELAGSLMKGQSGEQISKAAQELVEWSNKNRERLTALVRDEVRSQLQQLGFASREEVDALRRRVRQLEKEGGGTKKTAARKTTARPSPAKRRSAAGSTAAS